LASPQKSATTKPFQEASSFASGGQGNSFRENRPPGPVKHLQKLLFV
jgi:hypothetical protein